MICIKFRTPILSFPLLFALRSFCTQFSSPYCLKIWTTAVPFNGKADQRVWCIHVRVGLSAKERRMSPPNLGISFPLLFALRSFCTQLSSPHCRNFWTKAAPISPVNSSKLAAATKTTNFRYFHFRHLMKILVLIRTYHETYLNFHLCFETFQGLELIMRGIVLFIKFAKTIEYKK